MHFERLACANALFTCLGISEACLRAKVVACGLSLYSLLCMDIAYYMHNYSKVYSCDRGEVKSCKMTFTLPSLHTMCMPSGLLLAVLFRANAGPTARMYISSCNLMASDFQHYVRKM